MCVCAGEREGGEGELEDSDMLWPVAARSPGSPARRTASINMIIVICVRACLQIGGGLSLVPMRVRACTRVHACACVCVFMCVDIDGDYKRARARFAPGAAPSERY